MLYINFIIALVFCVTLLLFFREKTVWWEYLLQFSVPIVIVIICNLIMLNSNTTSTEYLGYYITNVKHYDRWNEWISQTCSRSYPCGTDSQGNTTYCTEYYDCSYCKDHPEYWVMVDNNNKEHEIQKITYDTYKDLWGTPMHFIDMHRHYHTIDGDAQSYAWNRNREQSITVTKTHNYTNKVKASYSLFKLKDISKKEADILGLFHYPLIVNLDKIARTNQNVVLGINIDETVHNKLKFINGYYGKNKQFKMFILFFHNKPQDIVYDQRDYWKGGNKNELVLCFGIDSTGRKQWFDAFSWCDRPKVEAKLRQYYSTRDTIDLNDLCGQVEYCLKYDYWQRKEFKDFNYVKPEITPTQFKILIILGIIANIGIGLFVILNDFRND